MSEIEHKYIKFLAQEVGFDLCGIARVVPLEENLRALERWIDLGYSSTLEYMSRNRELRHDASLLMEGARTVVVCAVSYKSHINASYTPQSRAKIASYACNRDYHKSLKKMLQQMLARLTERYPSLKGRALVDSAPIFEKRYAVEAGLGWIGRQSLLITPEWGSYVVLGELLLDMEVDSYDAPYSGVGCGECRRCVDACRVGAIVADKTIDARRCISSRTIEQEGDAELSNGEPDKGLNGWIFGCDECQMCCPYNLKAPPHRSPHFDLRFDPNTLSEQQWLKMSEQEFMADFAGTPLMRAGLERLKRNILKG